MRKVFPIIGDPEEFAKNLNPSVIKTFKDSHSEKTMPEHHRHTESNTTTKEATMLCRIHKTNTLFNSFKFLLSAAGRTKADVTTYNRILVESGDKACLVATDGLSIHVLELERLECLDFEAGDYEILKSDSKEIILFERKFEEPFPAWRKSVNHFKTTSLIASLNIRRSYDEDAIYELFAIGLKVELFRLNNLAGYKWKVERDKKGTTLILTSENLKAFVSLAPASKSEEEG